MRRLLVSGAIFLFVACSGRTPTTPETAGSEGSRTSGAAASPGPRRPGTRVVAPRTSAVRVALGVWGGDHVQLVLTDTGGALEYDCAHGTIDQPFVIDSSGRFDLAGTHTREHGGPIASDEKVDKRPARYTGMTDGQTMTLTVTVTVIVTGETESLGTFKLTRGQAGRILKCL